MHELLKELLISGLYSKLYKAGVVSSKFATYFDMALFVDAQIQTRGITKTQAVIEASIRYEVSEPTVWRAMSQINKPLSISR